MAKKHAPTVKRHTPSFTPDKAAVPATQVQASPEEYEIEEAGPEEAVEFLSIPAFLRRLPYRLGEQEMFRFSDKVAHYSRAWQLAIVSINHRQLSDIRVFPVSLMEYVYATMAKQFSWPKLVEIPAEPISPSGCNPKVLERLVKHLRAVQELATNEEVQHGTEVVLQWAEQERSRLQVQEPPAPPAVVDVQPVESVPVQVESVAAKVA